MVYSTCTMNLTIDEFVRQFEFESDNLSYVNDIGLVESYGIGVRGKILYDGEKVPVLGAVVLDPTTGDPVTDDKNSFTLYIDGLINNNTSEEIFQDEEAYTVMEELYTQVHGDSDMYQKREDVDIDPLADNL